MGTRLTSRQVLIGIVVGVALAAGVAFGGVAIAGIQTGPEPDWPKNERGQTYGSGLDATAPDNEPDLILARGTNGKVGYVLASDLNGPDPKTPEEALARQAARMDKDRTIPVYLSDGTTMIGSFVITNDPAILNTTLPE